MAGGRRRPSARCHLGHNPIKQRWDHLVATVEDGRLVLIPASVIPDDQAWFWTPEWQAKEAEADQEIAAGGGPVLSADELITELAQRAGLSADELT